MTEFRLQSDPELIGQAITIGDAVLEGAQPASIVSVSPFQGQGKAVNTALLAAIKLGLPAVGLMKTKKNIRSMWAGQGQWFITGDVDFQMLAEALIDKAAVTDQSDAWAAFTLTGSTAAVVLSRLCPLDFDALQLGQTARTELAHMLASITPVKDGYEVMVMRSFAKTAVQKVTKAMQNVAAQQAL